MLVSIYKHLFILLLVTISLSFIQPNSTWKAPEDSKKIKNPIASSTASIEKGKKIFSQYCVTCHGNEGRGNGPSARNLKVKPASFIDSSFTKQTDGEIFWKINEGRKEMASYKYSITNENKWHIINYLRTIK